MKAFQSFLPWIALAGISYISLPLALVVSLLLSAVTLMQGKGHILEWVSFVFFVVSLAGTLCLGPAFVGHYLSLLASLTLSGIAWASLLLHKPFTIYYAKQQVAEQFWTTPLFLRINILMTTVFGGFFSLAALLKVLQIFYPNLLPYSVLTPSISVCSILFVIWFPGWYKARAKRKGLHPLDDDQSTGVTK